MIFPLRFEQENLKLVPLKSLTQIEKDSLEKVDSIFSEEKFFKFPN